MKKPIALALALVLALSLAACGGDSAAPPGGDPVSAPPGNTPDDKGTSSESPGNSTAEASQNPSDGSSFAKPATISDSYKAYSDMKSAAYQSISEKIEQQDSLYLSVGMSLLAVVMVDLSFLPLTMIGMEGGMSALAILGMNDVDVEQKGDSYTIAYTNAEGEKITQTCEYDAPSDSVRSVITLEGTLYDSLILEYARSGEGYVCQYITQMENGDYDVLSMYFNGSGDVAIGMATTSAQPGSIYKKAGLDADFVLNDSSYFLLENGKLTVLIDGEIKTY